MYQPSVQPRIPRTPSLALALSLAAALPLGAQRTPSSAAAASATDRGSFVVLAGSDTVAVEQFTRTPTGVDAELHVRRGDLRVRHAIGYASNGRRIASYNTAFFAAGSARSAEPTQRYAFKFEGDTMVATVSGQSAVQRSVVRSGSLPWMNPSVLLLEEVTRRRRSARVEVPMINFTGDGPLTIVAATVGRDTIALTFPDVVFRLAVDARGRILGGRVPSQGVVITRTRAATADAGVPARPTDGPRRAVASRP